MKNNSQADIHVPMRRCVGCYKSFPKSQLIRLVKTKSLDYFLDQDKKGQGRGAYVCNDKACIEAALKKKGFNRSFHSPVDEQVLAKLTDR